MTTRAYAAASATAPLAAATICRREPGPGEIEIEILYCGVCHSDLHIARNEWGGTVYPCVPGHEIVGRVTRAGSGVKHFREGELAAVGCLVNSCGECASCREGSEQFCERGPVFTYNSTDPVDGTITYGGYAERVVVAESFALRVPAGLDTAATAPLLCAGITTYSPLRRHRVGPQSAVGVVGLGGLGHMAVKFAKAFGARVVVFTTSPGKAQDAMRLGADEVVVSTRAEEMKRLAGRLDFVIDTVSAPHDINACLALLGRDGTLVQVGVPSAPLPVQAFSLIHNRRNFTGSLIGGIRETQEMLDFCGRHGIVSDIELIPIQQVNDAYERLLRGEVKYRFVIDMASLRA